MLHSSNVTVHLASVRGRGGDGSSPVSSAKWMTWLAENWVVPFPATREEDMDDADLKQGAATRLFQVGHNLEVLGLEEEDETMGVIVKAKAKGQIGQLPLADLEVQPKTDRNYWPVREYSVWFANR